jgi:hypothetical protein
MHAPAYYREQAEHARRLAGLTHQSEMTDMLEQMAKDFEDIACDLKTARLTCAIGSRCRRFTRPVSRAPAVGPRRNVSTAAKLLQVRENYSGGSRGWFWGTIDFGGTSIVD